MRWRSGSEGLAVQGLQRGRRTAIAVDGTCGTPLSLRLIRRVGEPDRLRPRDHVTAGRARMQAHLGSGPLQRAACRRKQLRAASGNLFLARDGDCVRHLEEHIHEVVIVKAGVVRVFSLAKGERAPMALHDEVVKFLVRAHQFFPAASDLIREIGRPPGCDVLTPRRGDECSKRSRISSEPLPSVFDLLVSSRLRDRRQLDHAFELRLDPVKALSWRVDALAFSHQPRLGFAVLQRDKIETWWLASSTCLAECEFGIDPETCPAQRDAELHHEVRFGLMPGIRGRPECRQMIGQGVPRASNDSLELSYLHPPLQCSVSRSGRKRFELFACCTAISTRSGALQGRGHRAHSRARRNTPRRRPRRGTGETPSRIPGTRCTGSFRRESGHQTAP